MALIDLSAYDIFDLLMTKAYTDEEKGRYVYDYMTAFAGYISERVADLLNDTDEEEMKKLLEDPTVTPEKIELFYRKRIPNYDSFLLAGTLIFKKKYLLHFYTGIYEKAKKQDDPSTSSWEAIIKEAESDNWHEVAKLVDDIQRQYISSPSPLNIGKTIPA